VRTLFIVWIPTVYALLVRLSALRTPRRERGAFDFHEFVEVEAEPEADADAEVEVEIEAELESALEGGRDVEVLVSVEIDGLRVGTWLDARDTRDLGVAVPVVLRVEGGL
jgi:hypothetical protein